MNDEHERDEGPWWLECHCRDLAGEPWIGYLLDQGATKDLGGWIVIQNRDEATAEVSRAGPLLWIVPRDSREDRLIPIARLEHIELVEVG
jgi:hypothetical protein